MVSNMSRVLQNRAAEQLNGLPEGLASTAEAAAASQYPALDASDDGKEIEPSDELLFAKALLDAGEYQVHLIAMILKIRAHMLHP